MENRNRVQSRVVFYGVVQGVGFRYTVQDLAETRGLTGEVKNMPDGGVSLVVEGEKEDVQDLITKLEIRFSISDKHICESPVTESYRQFKIAF